MKKFTIFTLIAVLVLGVTIFLGACHSSGGGGGTPTGGGGGNTTIQDNTQGTQAASSSSQGINMALGTTQAFGNLTNIGLVSVVGIQAPQPSTFGNSEQSPAMNSLVKATGKFALAQSARTAASGIMGTRSQKFTFSGGGSCPDGGSYVQGASSDGGVTAIFFSGCRENGIQADGEYDILTLAPTSTGYSMSVTLGSSLTPTAFTLQDFGPGYSNLISRTTMTGLPISVAVTVSGSLVTSLTMTTTGGVSIYDNTTDQNYSVTLTNLSDAYALSTSGTGTTTTYTTNGTFAESWGSYSITATFTDFQLAITPGTASEDMSVSGTFSIAFTPAFCQNGTFTFVTDTPIVFDDSMGHTTSGELTVNGATTITYNDDGSITVTTGGQSQKYNNAFDLTQVCPMAAFGGLATYTVTYNGNDSTSGSVPVDSNMYQQGQTITVLGNTGNLVNTGYTFAGWNTQADGTGTTYTQAQTFAMGTANVTLYAQWTTNPTYTVTYNGNGNTGGSVPVDSTNYQQGAIVTVLGNTGALVNTGNTFAGWNTLADGSGTSYTPGQTFSMPAANVILYAKWTTTAAGTFPDTGQTTCYNSSGGVISCAGAGQDGSHIVNPLSYTDNGDGTVTDNVTGLLWQQCTNGLSGAGCATGTAVQYNWSDAANICANLSLAGTGWRLPMDFELVNLVDYGTYNPAINAGYFPNTQNDDYWSSTPYLLASGFAFVTNFVGGGDNGDGVANNHYVRCVR